MDRVNGAPPPELCSAPSAQPGVADLPQDQTPHLWKGRSEISVSTSFGNIWKSVVTSAKQIQWLVRAGNSTVGAVHRMDLSGGSEHGPLP